MPPLTAENMPHPFVIQLKSNSHTQNNTRASHLMLAKNELQGGTTAFVARSGARAFGAGLS
jgi:hypothetical protein